MLSVLALSSRFDGREDGQPGRAGDELSVLALSSRFDGPAGNIARATDALVFQYSLCRVVLMVISFRNGRVSRGASFSTRSVESF